MVAMDVAVWFLRATRPSGLVPSPSHLRRRRHSFLHQRHLGIRVWDSGVEATREYVRSGPDRPPDREETTYANLSINPRISPFQQIRIHPPYSSSTCIPQRPIQNP